ncbi:YPDG domain-containing protein, partial [Streptococcus suis]|uniref:YPDG domain-containing protein n=1 Tax=Streptococcus suis TaxID=1307 RepID=UPI0005165E12
MSSKDMFRKEQRFSFRKFSFGLASAVIANVIFGGAIASSPIVHANTAEPTSTVVPSERLASVSYTVNVVDQAGTVINTQTKNVSVQTTEATAVATANLTTDLVPEGYALVSGLGQETVTENAENVFTVVVEKATSEVATTEDSAATSEETSTATSETVNSTTVAASETSTKATSEVANTAAVAAAATETVSNKTERTAYLSYITHYVNEANETVDRRGHLVAVTTTDDTAKTQVTVSASENMPSGWELVQDKAKVVVQLVENQTNILVFAVTKKSKEEEIAASQLSNRDVLMRLSLEADLLADEALRQVAKEQAGNTALETAANETKAVAATANEVLANTAATEAELDDQIDTVRTSTQNLAAEMLKVDKDGILTAMLDATSQALTLTSSSTGAVRLDYPNHIRDYATNVKQQVYNGQDFYFGLIGKELTQTDSQMRVTASNPAATIQILNGENYPIKNATNFGLQDSDTGILYGSHTIKVAGDAFSWKFKATSGTETAESLFTFVPYTVVKTDEDPVRKAVTAGVTANEILAKVKSDVTRGNDTSSTTEATAGPLNIAFEQHFNSTLTARATGTSTTVADTDKAGKQIWHEIKNYVKVAEADGTVVSGTPVTGSLPTEAGTYDVTVLSTNVHGQTIENTVKVILNAAPSMPTIGVNPGTTVKNDDNRQLEALFVFGNVTGTTEAVSTSGSKTAPDFGTSEVTRKFLATDPENDAVTISYGVPGNVTAYEAGKPETLTTNGHPPMSAETGNLGRENSNQLRLDAEGKLSGEFPVAPGRFYSRVVKMTDTAGNVSYSNPFFVVGYTDKRADNTDLTVAAASDLTEANIFGKLTIDVTSGSGNTNRSLTVPTSEYTRKIVGYRLTGTTAEQTLSTATLNTLPAGKNYEIKVETTNPYGQTIYNWVPVNDTRTVGIDKSNLYVFKGSPIQTVAAGTYTADNVDKVKVVTVEDKDGVDAISYYQSPSNRVSSIAGITITPEASAEANQSVGYATGTPTAGVGVYSRSFGVTDGNNKLEFVNTNVNNVDNRQATHIMDATADGTLKKQAGETVTKDEILAKVKVNTGNSNTVVADPTTMYKMDLAPGETVPTAPGEYDVKVRVVTLSNVYKDVVVKVIIDKYADTLTATAAENTSLVPGSGTAVTQPIVINDANGAATTAPAGTTYAIDPAFKAEKEALGYEISVSPTGEVSVKAPAGQESDIAVPVTVTYPDKTTDSVSVPFKVNQKDTAQLKAKEAIDKKLADETKALEDKKNAEIAAITNNPDLTPDQKDAAVKDITDAAEIAKKALNDAAGVAKDNVDAATTPEEAKAAQTAGETTLADLENGAEAALDLITDKAEAKDTIADKLADEVKELEAKQAEAEKAIDASTMTPEEKDAA